MQILISFSWGGSDKDVSDTKVEDFLRALTSMATPVIRNAVGISDVK